MKLRSNLSGIIALSVLFLLLEPRISAAYLDPGTGSYLIQILIAAGLGAIFSIKIFWQRIKLFFKNTFNRKNA
jgi:hypothetical protein